MLITIDQVLDQNELTTVQKAIATARWQSGSHSAGKTAKRVKNNLEIDSQSQSWKTINDLVLTRLYQHPEFQSAVLPSKVSSAFVSKCEVGMHYGPHIDDPVMGPLQGRYRADVAVTVFLSAPSEYTGGELAINTQFGDQQVKLAAGSAVAYPASSLHQVLPVSSGERVVCALWVQSLVRDPAQREVLYELDQARNALKIATPAASVTTAVDRSYMNLLRMWSEV